MRAVITGAADGIGKALAYRFAVAGYEIIGIDRNVTQAYHTQAELTAAGASVLFLPADLAQETDLKQLLDRLTPLAPLDLFIHNAGISAIGQFAQLEVAQQQAVIQVNLVAPMYLTAGLLRRQLLNRPSSLVFIASLSHFTGYPGATAYAASKDGLTSYARSLSVALAAEAVQVLTVFPGPTRTAHARRYSPDNRQEHRRMPPEQVADLIFRAVQYRQRLLIPGWNNRLFAWIGHYLPPVAEFAMKQLIFKKLSTVRI